MSCCNLKNWKTECEDRLNQQINLEFWASYQYDLIASYFDRSTIGLNKLSDYFRNSSNEEREHAHKFIKYQNMRGGIVKFYNIENVDLNFLENIDINRTNDIILAFEKALEMEQKVYKSLLELHSIGEKSKDSQLCDFIESEFLSEQLETNNILCKYISQLMRINNNSHGLWNFANNFNVN